jgi:DNA modification methylase
MASDNKYFDDDLKRQLRERDRGRRAREREAFQARSSRGLRRNDLNRRMTLGPVKIAATTSLGRQTRRLTEAQIERAMASIEALGFCHPPLVARHGDFFRVVDGAVRIEAMRRLGYDEFPAVILEDVSEAEARTIRLAVNRLAELGRAWVMEELAAELNELIELDQPVQVAIEPQLRDQLRDLSEDETGVERSALEPAQGAVAVSRTGDRWRARKHWVVVGDCRDEKVVDRLLRSTAVVLVLTDEPWNVAIQGHVTKGNHREFAMASGEMTPAEFLDFNLAWIVLALRYLVDGGILGTFIDWRGLLTVLTAAEKLHLTQIAFITWAKTAPALGSFYKSQTELLPLFRKGTAPHINNIQLARYGRTRSNLWLAPGASTFGSEARAGLKFHPTVKPARGLLVPAVMDMTNPGDALYEPFLGSGSMLVACELTGRICYAIEIDALYIDVALRRFIDLTGEEPILEETGETFSQVAARRAAETAAATLAENAPPLGAPPHIPNRKPNTETI